MSVLPHRTLHKFWSRPACNATFSLGLTYHTVTGGNFLFRYMVVDSLHRERRLSKDFCAGPYFDLELSWFHRPIILECPDGELLGQDFDRYSRRLASPFTMILDIQTII